MRQRASEGRSRMSTQAQATAEDCGPGRRQPDGHRQPHRPDYELPITDGTVRGVDLRQIKADPEDFGLMSYDPAFMNTASCRSAVTFLDGDKGILEYRGYPIDQLAEQSILSGGGLPARQRRAADAGAARDMGRRDHDPHVRARERQGLHAGLPPRRAPDGHAARLGRRAVDVLSRRQATSRTSKPYASRRSA